MGRMASGRTTGALTAATAGGQAGWPGGCTPSRRNLVPHERRVQVRLRADGDPRVRPGAALLLTLAQIRAPRIRRSCGVVDGRAVRTDERCPPRRPGGP